MTTLNTPAPEIARDRWGRPLVTPPDGGKPVAYTRCTTFIDCLEDKFNLQKWMQRMVALGLASRPDLLLSVSAHPDDKRQLDRICDDAREAASASAKATTGTALHAITELPDRGLPLPVLPPNAKASIDAYIAATSSLKAKAIEQFLVLDTLKIGGTTDRIVEHGGELYIADIKTGSIDWGALKIAMQLSIYARSWAYDIATGERTPTGVSTNRGLIIHLPSVDDPADAKCELHWIDLEAGWQAVQVAAQVRDKRALKFKDLTEPFTGDAPERPSLRLQKANEARAAQEAETEAALLERMIRGCPTRDDVLALWQANEAAWTDHLSDVAREHIASVQAAS